MDDGDEPPGHRHAGDRGRIARLVGDDLLRDRRRLLLPVGTTERQRIPELAVVLRPFGADLRNGRRRQRLGRRRRCGGPGIREVVRWQLLGPERPLMIGRRFGRSERPRQDGAGQGLQAAPVGDEAIGGGPKVGKGEPVQLVVDLTQESPQLLSLCACRRHLAPPGFRPPPWRARLRVRLVSLEELPWPAPPLIYCFRRIAFICSANTLSSIDASVRPATRAALSLLFAAATA